MAVIRAKALVKLVCVIHELPAPGADRPFAPFVNYLSGSVKKGWPPPNRHHKSRITIWLCVKELSHLLAQHSSGLIECIFGNPVYSTLGSFVHD